MSQIARRNSEVEVKLAKFETEIATFLSTHFTALKEISKRSSSMFEGLCLVYVARYYESLGYKVKPDGLVNGLFRLKYSTQGRPDKFSLFRISSGDSEFEIRHNLPVQGAMDRTLTYVADVAVIASHSIRSVPWVTVKGRTLQRYFCPNVSLKTFAEVKDLAAYSMLIAQFLGVVFELKPKCINRRLFRENQSLLRHHIFPALMVSGPAQVGAGLVVVSLKRRPYAVVVACNLMQSDADFVQSQNQIRKMGPSKTQPLQVPKPK